MGIIQRKKGPAHRPKPRTGENGLDKDGSHPHGIKMSRERQIISIAILILSVVLVVVGVSFCFRDTPTSHRPLRSKSSLNKNSNPILLPTDSIYTKGDWDGAPIVLEDFRLIFFTTPKVGCTVFKQLFRRMMGYKDWFVQKEPFLPHDPDKNGLRYLYSYPPEQANAMLTSPDYTRAIFVRDPKERFLSAYLDKALLNNGRWIQGECCFWEKENRPKECKNNAFAENLEAFLSLTQTCKNPHWKPQAERMEHKYWPYINFIGHMETIASDTESLLEHVGAWNDFGQSGWGKFKNESIFSGVSVKHATGANHHLRQYYTSKEVEDKVEQVYAMDYSHPFLNLPPRKIFKNPS